MEYKGIEYSVVQAASPKGWKWAFRLDSGLMKSGNGVTRSAAIFNAENAIDAAIKAKTSE